jgi:ubiquinone/menaquinone biosynthesis C-methylase UbiE
VSDEMTAEFGTIAEWTAQVALELGTDYYMPAACRGSGSPAALDALIDYLHLAPGEKLLDCGAGVGGPAAYAAAQRSVHPILVEPEAGACRAARALFDHPVIQAAGSLLPLIDESFDAAWCLGVLCTMRAQLELLTELRRVVRPRGRIGLLVFVVRSPGGEHPAGNHFPTAAHLADLVERAGLRIENWQGTSELPPIPQSWQRREEEVTAMLRERYGRTKPWQLAERQGDLMGRLLADSVVTGEMLTLNRRT